ncbi:TetR/AcrR family transcriptional regulator [Sanguibacter antarcticus]|uniref:TetR family transcriptional regulator n=1 Tax=Sanguibacter antarcticus TaxID=372484 RepID=A0A2A9EA09_9MICO|nr:TetR/AcrR family transcriptional regulator [Sanguibacter antarcticus]PFG35082.1 TetR family transcriptional regulator [Sanguibacter antarcticus]
MPQPQPATDGRSTRWDDHRAARRIALVRAARKAVHQMGPEVSMDEIATFAKTSKSIVYRYFVDKPGLQLAVGEAVVEQMSVALSEAAQLATTPRAALESMVAVYLEMIAHSPNVYYFVTRTAPGLPFLESMNEIVAVPFAQEMNADAVDAAAWGAGAVGFIRGSGEWWLLNRTEPGAPTREELTDRVTAWLWGGPVGVLARGKP